MSRPAILLGIFIVLTGSLAFYFLRAKPTGSGVTFNRDVAPILHSRCAGCHHPGAAAPFSLLTYEGARDRAGQIVDLTQKRQMPPWLPVPGHGDFANSRRLTDSELQTLRQWFESGAPHGEGDTPPAPTFDDDWHAGRPDLVLETPAYSLPAAGGDVFRNFVVAVPPKQPRWVRSIELKPDNPRVTHHARLGVDRTLESIRRDAADPEPGYAGMAWAQDPDGQLVLWAPGLSANPDLAWKLPPQSSLVLHSHLQPSGKPETVKFRIGIRFAEGPPAVQPMILRIGTGDIDIPAGAAHHVVTDRYPLPIEVDVHAIFPHAHSLCRDLQVIAEKPDGTKEPLIRIDRFDENWHDLYRYRQPVRLPRGTKLVSTFAFDNTAENARNRSRPPRRVVYGSNAADEMADVYLQITPVHPDQRAVLREHHQTYDLFCQLTGYRKNLEQYPNDPWTQEGFAACLVGLGQAAKAIPILEQRLKASSATVFPTVSLGMVLISTGNPARAESLFREAIAKDPEYPLAWFGLGQSLKLQSQAAPAEQAFAQVLKLAPGMLEARLELADLLVKKDALDEAATLCHAALADSPEAANLHLKLADISAHRKHYDEALRSYAMARQHAPYIHPPKVLLAVFCVAHGDTHRGQTYLAEARIESPEHPMPPLLLWQLARRQGNAMSHAGILRDATSKPIPDNWPESHRQRFLVLLHSERYQLALILKDDAMAKDALTQWLKADPMNAQARKLLAEQ